MSDPVRPHRRQPTRLHRPWDSPGKNIGVGCHFLLQCMKVKTESEVAQSCPTLRDHMDCSLPGSSVHGVFQARVLEWGAIAALWLASPQKIPVEWKCWSLLTWRTSCWVLTSGARCCDSWLTWSCRALGLAGSCGGWVGCRGCGGIAGGCPLLVVLCLVLLGRL